MKKNSLFLIVVIEVLVVTLLQLIPENINAELLVTNSKFIFGLVGSNNIAIAILLLALVVFVYLTSKSKMLIYSLADAMLIAGIASNLLDRIFRDGATDYISIGNFPTFNIADILIVIGIIVLGISYILKLEK